MNRGVTGFIGGFASGYAATGAIFSGPVALLGGGAGGVVGAIGGYAGAKIGAEAAWDAIANAFNG